MVLWVPMVGETKMDSMEPAEIKLATEYSCSFLNKPVIQESRVCGCFYCLAIFQPQEITDWFDDGKTAVCPKCSVDSVIGSASGFEITSEFLKQMREKYFATPAPPKRGLT